jgi:uncharacterized membrane protein YbaN (DUF454 family)
MSPGPVTRRASRLVCAGLGILCVALAGIGVLLPGVPTTIFVIAASFLFARSSPALDRRLRNSRWFGPSLRVADGGGMSRRSKAAALLSMWIGIGLSVAVLGEHGFVRLVVLLLGVAGTITITFYVRTAEDQVIKPSTIPRGVSS